MKIESRRHRSEGMAECEQCNDLAVDASRTDAMRHASKRGHLVHFIVEDSTVYDGRRAAALNPTRCIASRHIPTTGAACSVCGAAGMQHEDDHPRGRA